MQSPDYTEYAVLFDLYGTLVDVSIDEDSLEFWQSLLIEGQDVEVAMELRKFYRQRCRKWLRELAAGQSVLEHVFPEVIKSFSVRDRDIELFSQRFRRGSRRKLEVRPYAHSVVQKISARGIATGIISNTEALLTNVDLHDLGMANVGDIIVLSSDVEAEKPSPVPFRIAMDALAVAPDRSLFIGDNPQDDIHGALGAGMFAALIRSAPDQVLCGISTEKFLGVVSPVEEEIARVIVRFLGLA